MCGREAKPGKHLHVDHRHADGLTRGILCWIHNAAIGKLRDNAEHARRIAAYLDAPPVTSALGRNVYGLTGSRESGGPEKLRKWAERTAKREAVALANSRAVALREERTRRASTTVALRQNAYERLATTLTGVVDQRHDISIPELAAALGEPAPGRARQIELGRALALMLWRRYQARIGKRRTWRYRAPTQKDQKMSQAVSVAKSVTVGLIVPTCVTNSIQ